MPSPPDPPDPRKLARFVRAAWKALYRAHRGGLEGVEFGTLVAYLRVKRVVDRGYSVGLTTAQQMKVIRVCQGELSEGFTDAVVEAVRVLMDRGLVVVSTAAGADVLFLTARGRWAYPRAENEP